MMADIPAFDIDWAKVEAERTLYQAAERIKTAQSDLAAALEAYQKSKDAYDAALKAVHAASQAIESARRDLFIAAGGQSEAEHMAFQWGL